MFVGVFYATPLASNQTINVVILWRYKLYDHAFYYTNLNAWKIDLGEQNPNPHQNAVQEVIEQSQEEKIDSISLEEEDLEF